MSEENKPVEEAKKPDLSEEQLKRCIPVAHRLVKIISDAELPLGNLKKEEVGGVYDDVIKTSLQSFLDADLQVGDVQLVLALAMQSLDLVLKGVDHAMKINLSAASEKLWKMSPEEVRLQDIDKMLRS